MNNKSRFLHGQPIEPPAIEANMSIVDLIDKTFNAYNAARFREACHLFAERMLADDVTGGMSLSGRRPPADLGMARVARLLAPALAPRGVCCARAVRRAARFGIGCHR